MEALLELRAPLASNVLAESTSPLSVVPFQVAVFLPRSELHSHWFGIAVFS